MSHATNSTIVGQHGQLDVGLRPTKRFRRASDVEISPTKWLWPDHIPIGNITVLEGVPGHGKSVVSYDLAACVTLGKSIPHRDHNLTPAGVVILQGEDDHKSTVVPCLEEAGADCDQIIPFEDLILPDRLADLERAVVEVQAKLVIIDPITSFFGPSVNNDQSVRRVLSPLRELAQRHELAVLLVRHLRKSNSRSNEYKGAGSVGIIGAARSGLSVEGHPNEFQFYHQLSNFKGNLASALPQPYRTVKCSSGAITVKWLRKESHYSTPTRSIRKPKSKVDEAADFLYQKLGNGPVPSYTLLKEAKDNDIAEKTLRRAKKQEAVDDWKQNDGKRIRTFWELPNHREGFFVEVATVLESLLNESRVTSSNLSPRVIIQKDQIIVVKSHVGGGPNIQIDLETIPSRNATIIVAQEGNHRVEIETSDPDMHTRFRESMQQFNLIWDDAVYENLTAK